MSIVNMGDIVDNLVRQEQDTLYQIKIHTTKGISAIEFRNSSNGYYGGWIEAAHYSTLHKEELAGNVRMMMLYKDYIASSL